MTASERWFDNYAVDNVEDLLAIGALARDAVNESIKVDLGNAKNVMAIYGVIFEALVETVGEYQKSHDSYEVELADRLGIGFNNDDNEDDEKSGNFNLVMWHVENKDKNADEPMDADEDSSVVLSTEWNSKNITDNKEFANRFMINGLKKLKEIINIPSESHEFIAPVFCIIHTQILKYINLKFGESADHQFELNVMGLYTIGIQITDNADLDIYYHPTIYGKLSMKNDAVAARAEG